MSQGKLSLDLTLTQATADEAERLSGEFDQLRAAYAQVYKVNESMANSFTGQLLTGAGQFVPQTAAALLPFAGIVALQSQNFQYAWEDAERAAKESGRSFDPDRAFAYAETVAFTSAVLDRLQVGKGVKPWVKGNKAATIRKGLMKVFRSAVVGGGISTVQGAATDAAATRTGVEERNPFDPERRGTDFVVGGALTGGLSTVSGAASTLLKRFHLGKEGGAFLQLPNEAWFSNPKGRLEIGRFSKEVLDATGKTDKPIILSENIVRKNALRHPDVSLEETKQILSQTLLHPEILIRDKPVAKPDYWVFFASGKKPGSTVIELSETKDGYEIVNWFTLRPSSIAQKIRRAKREGGQVLITGNPAAAGLSALTLDPKISKALEEFNVNPDSTAKQIVSPDVQPGNDSGIRFSKGGTNAEELGRQWMELAKDERTARLGPTPKAKDLPTILKELSPAAAESVKIREERALNGSVWGYTFIEPGNRSIEVSHYNANEVFINSQYAGEQSTPVYQTIYAWAYNNGLKVIEDPGALSDIAVLRRTSQMLSSALRFGTTRHMEPGKRSGISGWRNEGTTEATQHNIGLLALREAELVKERLSELDGVRYDAESQSFYDGEYRIPANEVEAYLRRRIAAVDPRFSRGAGDSTLRRALATLVAQGTGASGGGRLVGDDAKAPESFARIRYSDDAGGGSAISESRPGAAGEESGGAFGEAGRGSKGVSSQEAAQVRGWTQDILNGWGSKLDVVVHDSAEGIADARLREAVQEQGGNVEAFFSPDGRIHLLADRVGSKADAERLLRHEGIHWAVRGPMQEEYQGILNGVRQRISPEEWDALSKSYAESPDHVRVEEYLAYLGQTNPRATAWQSFVYEVKQMLRNAFGKDFEVTDGDVLAFLQKANRRAEKGDGIESALSGEGDIRFSKNLISASDGGPNDLIAGRSTPISQDEAVDLIRANPSHPTAQALKAWFGAEHREIQSGKSPEKEGAMRRFLQRLPFFQSRGPLFRGVAFWNENQRRNFIQGFTADTWVNNRSFMSASKDGVVAVRLVESCPHPVVMCIQQAKTSKDLALFTSILLKKYDWQKEVMFERGAKFRVKQLNEIDLAGRKGYSVVLEEF